MLLLGQNKTPRPWISISFLASLPFLPTSVGRFSATLTPSSDPFPPLYSVIYPLPRPVLKIEESGLVALMRVRKLEKAVHLRGLLNLAERK